MSDSLVINTTGGETRVALVEDGVLAELYVERHSEKGIVGNIYKGRVVRVLPGMQAAFVDIGTDRAAFLYVSEVLNEHESFSVSDVLSSSDEEEIESDEDSSDSGGKNRRQTRRQRSKAKIEELLKEGQEILVQAAKDPIGTKGARLTCHITLPGRHLVFMPTVDHIGISRRITKDRERKRLRNLIDEIRPEGSG
ncbi:MAG: ribonuclease E/G, partial [Myxococcales bacterium]|nr:ribonuclease E/G [Myxococcales bacterium]